MYKYTTSKMDDDSDDMPVLVSDSDSDFDEPIPAKKTRKTVKTNEQAAKLWLSITQKQEKRLHIHEYVIKIYTLGPFLFGHVDQPDKWIRWAYEVGLLTKNCETKIESLTDEEMINVDMIEKSIDTLIDCTDLLKNHDVSKYAFVVDLLKVVDLCEKSVTLKEGLTKFQKLVNGYKSIKEYISKVSDDKNLGKIKELTALMFAARQFADHINSSTKKGECKLQIFIQNFKDDQKKSEEVKKKGNESFVRGNYRKAATLYQKAIFMNSFNHILYGNRAQAYLKIQDFRAAASDGRRTIVLNPIWPKGQYRYAKAYLELGNIDKAKVINDNARLVCTRGGVDFEDLQVLFDQKEKIIAIKDRRTNKHVYTAPKTKFDDTPINSHSDDSDHCPELVSSEESDSESSSTDSEDDKTHKEDLQQLDAAIEDERNNMARVDAELDRLSTEKEMADLDPPSDGDDKHIVPFDRSKSTENDRIARRQFVKAKRFCEYEKSKYDRYQQQEAEKQKRKDLSKKKIMDYQMVKQKRELEHQRRKDEKKNRADEKKQKEQDRILEKQKKKHAKIAEQKKKDEVRRMEMKKEEEERKKKEKLEQLKDKLPGDDKEQKIYIRQVKSYMLQGSEAFLSEKSKHAIEYFDEALKVLAQKSNTYCELDETEYAILKYSSATARLKTGGLKEILTAIEIYARILQDHNIRFPLSYLGQARAYYRLNRFGEALDRLVIGLRIVLRGVDLGGVLTWPGVLSIIPETMPGQLKIAFEQLIIQCKNPPRPDAVCRLEDCNSSRQEIYFSDPDFKGFIRIMCWQHCSLQYHFGCWRKVKGKYLISNDKDFITEDCFTPNCDGSIVKLTMFDTDGLIKREINGEPVKKSISKDSETVYQKIRSENPEKLLKKQEKKERRKQRKIEHKMQELEKDDILTQIEDMVLDEDRGSSISSFPSTQSRPDTPVILMPENQDYMPPELGTATVLKKDEDQFDGDWAKGQKKEKKKKKKEKPKKGALSLQKFVTQNMTEDEIAELMAQQAERRYGEEAMESSPFDPDNPFTVPTHLRDRVADFEGVIRDSVPNTDLEVMMDQYLKSFKKEDAQMADTLYCFVHGLLLEYGPLTLDDVRLQREVSDFPPEAHKLIEAMGGLNIFLLKHRRFVKTGAYLCIVPHLYRAQQLEELRRQNFPELSVIDNMRVKKTQTSTTQKTKNKPKTTLVKDIVNMQNKQSPTPSPKQIQTEEGKRDNKITVAIRTEPELKTAELDCDDGVNSRKVQKSGSPAKLQNRQSDAKLVDTFKEKLSVTRKPYEIQSNSQKEQEKEQTNSNSGGKLNTIESQINKIDMKLQKTHIEVGNLIQGNDITGKVSITKKNEDRNVSPECDPDTQQQQTLAKQTLLSNSERNAKYKKIENPSNGSITDIKTGNIFEDIEKDIDRDTKQDVKKEFKMLVAETLNKNGKQNTTFVGKDNDAGKNKKTADDKIPDPSDIKTKNLDTSLTFSSMDLSDLSEFNRNNNQGDSPLSSGDLDEGTSGISVNTSTPVGSTGLNVISPSKLSSWTNPFSVNTSFMSMSTADKQQKPISSPFTGSTGFTGFEDIPDTLTKSPFKDTIWGKDDIGSLKHIDVEPLSLKVRSSVDVRKKLGVVGDVPPPIPLPGEENFLVKGIQQFVDDQYNNKPQNTKSVSHNKPSNTHSQNQKLQTADRVPSKQKTKSPRDKQKLEVHSVDTQTPSYEPYKEEMEASLLELSRIKTEKQHLDSRLQESLDRYAQLQHTSSSKLRDLEMKNAELTEKNKEKEKELHAALKAVEVEKHKALEYKKNTEEDKKILKKQASKYQLKQEEQMGQLMEMERTITQLSAQISSERNKAIVERNKSEDNLEGYSLQLDTERNISKQLQISVLRLKLDIGCQNIDRSLAEAEAHANKLLQSAKMCSEINQPNIEAAYSLCNEYINKLLDNKRSSKLLYEEYIGKIEQGMPIQNLPEIPIPHASTIPEGLNPQDLTGPSIMQQQGHQGQQQGHQGQQQGHQGQYQGHQVLSNIRTSTIPAPVSTQTLVHNNNTSPRGIDSGNKAPGSQLLGSLNIAPGSSGNVHSGTGLLSAGLLQGMPAHNYSPMQSGFQGGVIRPQMPHPSANSLSSQPSFISPGIPQRPTGPIQRPSGIPPRTHGIPIGAIPIRPPTITQAMPINPPSASAVPAVAKNSFEKIMMTLCQMFPTYTRDDVTKVIQGLRAAQRGSLSGMSLEDIIHRASDMILNHLKKQQEATVARSTVSNKLMMPSHHSMPTIQPILLNSGKNTPELFQEEEDPCVICHEEMSIKHGNTISLKECRHSFHIECIRKWLRENSTCPTCRVHALLPDEFPSLN